MDNPGDISAQGQQNVQPEMSANADLHENTQGGRIIEIMILISSIITPEDNVCF